MVEEIGRKGERGKRTGFTFRWDAERVSGPGQALGTSQAQTLVRHTHPHHTSYLFSFASTTVPACGCKLAPFTHSIITTMTIQRNHAMT